MNKKQLNIYHKGAEAYRKGKNIKKDCPYKKEKDRSIWEQGFNNALMDQTCDNPE